MAIYEFEGKKPRIGHGTYVAETAAIIGDVVIGSECYVAPGAVVKGDYGSIRIGDGTSVQDNVVVHARPGEQTVIGDNVTLGHGCIVHNATIRDNAVIGMGAIVSDYTDVGEWAIVAEGAVVKARFKVPAGKVAVGVPAKIIGDLSDEQRRVLDDFKSIYRSLAERYPRGLRRLD